jgi:putative transposase
VPKRKRVQREHTEDWQTIQQYTIWPEQTAYELLRPVVLFGDPATKRAEETGEPRTSLERKADAFDEQGMVNFFASRPRKQPQETARSLPPDMRQLIVDLRVEMPNMSIREIAEICDTRFQRRPSHHSIKTVLASGPPPSIQMRRFPLFNDIPDPAQRRHNIVPVVCGRGKSVRFCIYSDSLFTLVFHKLRGCIKELLAFSEEKKDMPTLKGKQARALYTGVHLFR